MKYTKFSIFLICIVIAAASLYYLPQEHQITPPSHYKFEGRVHVIDGDSIVLKNQEMRLKGIDAPELHQSCKKSGHSYFCGKEAKQHLIYLTKGKTITCFFDNFDKYQRALATCYDGDKNLNRKMVLDGQAVNYYDYPKEEALAKKEKKGIWRSKFLPPHKWRRTHPYHKNKEN